MYLPRVSFALLLLLGSLACIAQDQLRITSSIPLPQEDEHNLGFGWDPNQLGCAQDGSFFIQAGHGMERVSPFIMRFSANGTLLWTVDSQNVPGLGKTALWDFAPGPGGELYLLVKRIAQEYSYVDDDGRRVPGGRADHPDEWLVRYDAEGRFVDKKLIPFAHEVHIAALPSGDIFMLSYTIQGPRTRVGDPPHPWAVLAGIFSKDGVLLHKVIPPDFFLDNSSGRPRQPSTVPLPMLGPDGNIYVVEEGKTPALAVISPDGTVLRSLALAIPRGKWLDNSRLYGQNLVALMRTDPDPPGGALNPSFAEFDTETGRMIANYSTTKTDWRPACDEGSGLTGINLLANTLDVLEPIRPTKQH